MKKVLMLAYYFPPLGMGGTQRALKMVRYLPEFGWEATVLTVKPIAYWAQDPSLLREIPAARIIRTGSLDPQRLLHLVKNRPSPKAATIHAEQKHGFVTWINRKVLPLFLVPDSKRLWHAHACAAAAPLLRREAFALIYSTSPPHSVHLTARRLAQKYHLPWVADFRDAWSGSVVVQEPTRLHRALQQRLQKKIVRAADAVIAVTPGILKSLQGEDCGAKYHYIPNGFDAGDFPPQTPAPEDDAFQLLHCGAVTTFSDPRPVLNALKQLRRDQPGETKQLRLRFVGYDTFAMFQEWIQTLQLQDCVHHSGYVPHHQALQAVGAADALLLIACHEKDANFIPGKTFEYLASGKPILAVSNIADTVALLRDMPGVILCHPRDEAAIRSALLRLQKDTGLAQAARQRNLQPYERKYQARQLADIFDQLSA